jgi:lipoprotein-releasing system permease protein
MFLILTLIILVAAFNIISSLVMLVKDKRRTIGMLRAMGATQGAILRIFVYCGMTIGIAGTLAGVGLGVAFATHIEPIRQYLQSLTGVPLFDPVVYFLSTLPAVITPSRVWITGSIALLLTFLATLYPAHRAARLDPIVVLRDG